MQRHRRHDPRWPRRECAHSAGHRDRPSQVWRSHVSLELCARTHTYIPTHTRCRPFTEPRITHQQLTFLMSITALLFQLPLPVLPFSITGNFTTTLNPGQDWQCIVWENSSWNLSQIKLLLFLWYVMMLLEGMALLALIQPCYFVCFSALFVTCFVHNVAAIVSYDEKSFWTTELWLLISNWTKFFFNESSGKDMLQTPEQALIPFIRWRRKQRFCRKRSGYLVMIRRQISG